MKDATNIIMFTDLTIAKAEKFVRELSEDSSKVFFSSHSKKRMRERKISTTQVFRCLQAGRLVDNPFRETNGSWNVKLSVMSAGALIRAVAALDYEPETGNYIIIVTVF